MVVTTSQPTRILLVDDSGANRKLFQRILNKHFPEVTVVTARDAESGEKLVEEQVFACGVVDVHLPGMSGLELCRRLKSRPGVHFPILLITSSDASLGLKVEGLDSGADAFLYSPFEESGLVAQVRVLLRIWEAEDHLRGVNRHLSEMTAERSRELQESNERFRMVFESSGDLGLVVELPEPYGEGRILEVNAAACEWLGYSREELLRLHLRELVAPERLPLIPKRTQQFVQQGDMKTEMVVVTREGKKLTLLARARLLTGPPEMHALVMAQRPSFEGAPGAGDAGPLVVYESNLLTGEMQWNGALSALLGVARGAVGALDHEQWRKRIHPDDREPAVAAWTRAVAGIDKYHLSYRIQHADGSYRRVEDTGIVLPGDDGHALRTLGTLRDVGSREEQQEKRQAERLQQQKAGRLESLGILAGGIAHDFNNILAAIIGLTDLSIRELPTDSEVHADLKEALQAAHRAKELVRQILAFTRPSGEERAVVYLHLIVREAVKLLRASLPATIELIDRVDVHSGAVRANASQMHQVVMNYGTNAAQSLGGTGGIVEFRLEDVEVGEELASRHPRLYPGPYVRLSVTDNGHGIPAEIQGRIFDPFYTTRAPGEGTGMGLALVHGIVADHGGAIVVESRPGQGATFHTYLPRVDAGQTREDAKGAGLPRGSERVLFVDDEETVRRFGKKALPRLGYEVVVCGSGSEALETFRASPDSFDIVITDQIMPKMTGTVLAGEIHRIRPELPIIAFTGYSTEVSDEGMQAAGIQEVIRKPAIARDLGEAIRRVLDRRAKSVK